MKPTIQLKILIPVLFFLSGCLYPQNSKLMQDGQKVFLELRGGDILRGTIQNCDDYSVNLKLRRGEMRKILKGEISDISRDWSLKPIIISLGVITGGCMVYSVLWLESFKKMTE